jgi:predicted DNA-binding protein (UPF0251 family)
MKNLESKILKVEELEAIRLVDLEGLHQEEAAKKMGVSRKTLWRDLESARKKVACALTYGNAIEIQGGNYEVEGKRTFECHTCNDRWEEPFGTGHVNVCPVCNGRDFERVK